MRSGCALLGSSLSRPKGFVAHYAKRCYYFACLHRCVTSDGQVQSFIRLPLAFCCELHPGCFIFHFLSCLRCSSFARFAYILPFTDLHSADRRLIFFHGELASSTLSLSVLTSMRMLASLAVAFQQSHIMLARERRKLSTRAVLNFPASVPERLFIFYRCWTLLRWLRVVRVVLR